MDCKFLTSTDCAARCVFSSCASVHSVNSISAILSVSLRSMSILLNTLFFLPFQIYHKIHAKWWSSIRGSTLQKRWSIFVKRELVGKIAGFDSVLDSAQTWRARGHSKNTWFIDSLPAPHLAQHMSPCIPLASKFFFTVMHPDTICHKKCLTSGGIVPSSKTLLRYPLWGQNCLVIFLYPGRPVLIGILI